MEIKEKYQLKNNVTEKFLKDYGFRNNIFRCWVYKNVIQLIVCIEIESKEWDYQVYDIDHNIPYTDYYNREFGINNVTKAIDKNINNIFREFEKAKIFTKTGN